MDDYEGIKTLITLLFLAVVFIILKLIKIIKWSWLLTLIPLWLFILCVSLTIIGGIIEFIADILYEWANH